MMSICTINPEDRTNAERLTCGLVILNYKDYALTEELLSNIKDFPEIDYIAVVDNDSPNDSYDRLKKYENDKISVLQSGRNGGYSFGNNVGVRYLIENYNPDIIGIANPDTEFDGELVEKIKEVFAANPDYAMLSGFQIKPSGENGGHPFWDNNDTVIKLYNSVLWELFVRPFINVSRKVLRLNTPTKYERWIESIRTSNKPLNEVWAIEGSMFFVRTYDFVKVGMFDDGVFMYNEENILAFKLHKIGMRLGIVNEVTFIHNHIEPVDDTPIKRMDRGMNYIRLSEQSALYYFNKYITSNIILQAGYKLLMRLRYLKSISAVLVKKLVLKLRK